MSTPAPPPVACPYCTEKIAADAIVCRYCHRDLLFFMPLRKELQALQQRLDIQQEQNRRLAMLIEKLVRRPGGNDDDLIGRAADIAEDAEREQADLAASSMTANGRGGARAASARGPAPPSPGAIVLLVLLPILALLAAHGLVVMLFDLNPLVLRIVSIAIPALLGLAFTLRYRVSLPRQALAGAVIAGLSVAGMTAVVSWVDEQPFLPQNIVEWREIVNYMLSIAFSHLTGVFGGLLIARRRNRSMDQLSRLLAGALGAGDQGPNRGENLRRHAATIKEVLTVVTPILTALISIITGVSGLLKR